MNSTPIISARIIRFTALLPPPPTPMTLMSAKCSASDRSGMRGISVARYGGWQTRLAAGLTDSSEPTRAPWLVFPQRFAELSTFLQGACGSAGRCSTGPPRNWQSCGVRQPVPNADGDRRCQGSALSDRDPDGFSIDDEIARHPVEVDDRRLGRADLHARYRSATRTGHPDAIAVRAQRRGTVADLHLLTNPVGRRVDPDQQVGRLREHPDRVTRHGHGGGTLREADGIDRDFVGGRVDPRHRGGAD